LYATQELVNNQEFALEGFPYPLGTNETILSLVILIYAYTNYYPWVKYCCPILSSQALNYKEYQGIILVFIHFITLDDFFYLPV
jgi:hypothetical protein